MLSTQPKMSFFNCPNNSHTDHLLTVILINIKTTYFRLFEWIRVVARYYPREIKFIWIDFLLALHYIWQNPHRVSREFLKHRGESNIYAFGETPLTTLDCIAKKCQLQSKDILFELGCGSGRTCFWLNTFVKCRVVGIDYLPKFIKKAQKIKKLVRLTQVEFIEQNFLSVDLCKATVIYLYGTCLEEKLIEELIEKFSHLLPRTKLISVSYPLTDYSPQFKLIKTFSVHYPWGKAEVFLQEKI